MADISNISSKSTRKILGDAGEHYALSRFTFSGKPAMKMPEGWRGYDLGVETGAGLARVSVKTRSDIFESSHGRVNKSTAISIRGQLANECGQLIPKQSTTAFGLAATIQTSARQS